MSDGAVMMIPLMGMSLVLTAALAAGGYYVYTQKKTTTDDIVPTATAAPTVSPTPTGVPTSLKWFSDDARVLLATPDGKYYFSTKTNSKKQCDSMLTTIKADATRIKLNKVGSSWEIRPDCTRNGDFSGFLTDEAADLVQKRETNKKKVDRQRWTIDCPAGVNGCTIRSSSTTKRYLGSGSDGNRAPVLTSTSSSGPSWIFQNAV